ncbi:MAG: TonB family protein [Candidatus Omnitrophica bacterium]|nr:TonB family protein [Candidatus Omnitrophota bacterium]
MSDRMFLISFSASVGLHLLLVIGQFLSWRWFDLPRQRLALEVIYETLDDPADELQLLKEQLTRATRETSASPAPSVSGAHTQIRIPDRPLLAAEQPLAALMPDRGPIVDLTNLVDAARGDPVLLSYFGAIREQIQRKANEQAWLAGETHQGLVYVSFLLTASGRLQEVGVVTERSAGARPLWEAALRIIRSSAPFPPFPPSMADPSKTIIVPLEFLVDS